MSRIFSVMWSNNNCNICTQDWFPCFYHQTEQGNHRQQTSLRHVVESHAKLYIYYRNQSPVKGEVSSK